MTFLEQYRHQTLDFSLVIVSFTIAPEMTRNSSQEEWKAKWQVCFHPEKCTVIRDCTTSRFRKNIVYKLHNHILGKVDCSKYLGVNISEDLSFKKHIDYTAVKNLEKLRLLTAQPPELS